MKGVSMKKFLTKMVGATLAAAMAILPMANASAASFSVSLNGASEFETSTTLTATLGGYSDIDMTYGGIMVVTAELVYDASKISVSVAGANGFNATGTLKLVFDRADGVASGASFATFKVTNVGLSNGETATVTLKNIVGSDSEVDAVAGSVSKTVKYVKAETPAEPTKPTEPSSPSTPSKPTTTPSKTTTNTSKTTSGNTTKTQELAKTEEVAEEKSDDEGKVEEIKVWNTTTYEEPKTEELAEENGQFPVWAIVVIVLAAVVIIGAVVAFIVIRKKNRK